MLPIFLFFLFSFQTQIQISLCYNQDTQCENFKTSNCKKNGPEIRFPLRLNSTNQYCGAPVMNLTCSPNNDTLLSLPNLGSHEVVQHIDYLSGDITIKLGNSWPSCLLQNRSKLKLLTTPVYMPSFPQNLSIVTCEKSFNRDAYSIVGPISCMSSSGHYVYVVSELESMDVLPLDCTMSEKHIDIFQTNDRETDKYPAFDLVRDFLLNRLVTLDWFDMINVTSYCKRCEERRKHCGFDMAKNGPICKPHKLNIKLISAACATALVLLLTIPAVVFYLSRKSDKEKETRLKVERFLARYNITKPTRYTFTEIKKITKRLRDKLGEGGFGSVYKGELPSGLPVAVKMLEMTKGAGEEFINEVATIGRIHHVNIVRLLGFCSEGTRRALVYEFMPNESLEKYIKAGNNSVHQPLSKEKMLQIAIGIARGIEYLHQGCNERILHFDIKPHNILLDEDLTPKIADFGLAKLCAKDQSIITMTAARGTMGYIAPEVYSRNFGTVSYKSDVYSFGMLLLEMVGGRKTMDPELENQNENYSHELLFNQLLDGRELQLEDLINSSDTEIAKKLIIVGFWCVQWNPVDRPSMTKVVHMLIGNLQDLQMPPKPFVSSPGHGNGFIVGEV